MPPRPNPHFLDCVFGRLFQVTMSYSSKMQYSPAAFDYFLSRRLHGGPRPCKRIGPVSLRFHDALIFQAEMKLWQVYDELIAFDVGLPNYLATFDVRIAFSWYIGFYALDWPGEAILRRIRHDFHLRREERPTPAEASKWVRYLCNVRKVAPKQAVSVKEVDELAELADM